MTKHEVVCGEAVQHLMEKMRKDGAPEEAITQLLSMLLELSTRLLYADHIKIRPEGLIAETPAGPMELNFAQPTQQ